MKTPLKLPPTSDFSTIQGKHWYDPNVGNEQPEFSNIQGAHWYNPLQGLMPPTANGPDFVGEQPPANAQAFSHSPSLQGLMNDPERTKLDLENPGEIARVQKGRKTAGGRVL